LEIAVQTQKRQRQAWYIIILVVQTPGKHCRVVTGRKFTECRDLRSCWFRNLQANQWQFDDNAPCIGPGMEPAPGPVK
jgi:hypothetical protein